MLGYIFLFEFHLFFILIHYLGVAILASFALSPVVKHFFLFLGKSVTCDISIKNAAHVVLFAPLTLLSRSTAWSDMAPRYFLDFAFKSIVLLLCNCNSLQTPYVGQDDFRSACEVLHIVTSYQWTDRWIHYFDYQDTCWIRAFTIFLSSMFYFHSLPCIKIWSSLSHFLSKYPPWCPGKEISYNIKKIIS